MQQLIRINSYLSGKMGLPVPLWVKGAPSLPNYLPASGPANSLTAPGLALHEALHPRQLQSVLPAYWSKFQELQQSVSIHNKEPATVNDYSFGRESALDQLLERIVRDDLPAEPSALDELTRQFAHDGAREEMRHRRHQRRAARREPYYVPETVTTHRALLADAVKDLDDLEQQILLGLAAGKSFEVLALRLGRSPKTLRNRLYSLKRIRDLSAFEPEVGFYAGKDKGHGRYVMDRG